MRNVSDVKIFRRELKNMLDEEEKLIADRGYRDDECITSLAYSTFPHVMFTRAPAQHKVINRRIKQFRSVGGLFRHDLFSNGKAFIPLQV